MDNIDTSIDLDSIAAEHQRLMNAYLAATSQPVAKDPPLKEHPKDPLKTSNTESIIPKSHDIKNNTNDHQIIPYDSQLGVTRKYVHPNWVSPGLISWLEDDVMMTTILPPELDIQKHPGVFDMDYEDLERDQEQAVACGATSWKEYFQKVDDGLAKPIPSGSSTFPGHFISAERSAIDSKKLLNPQDHPQYFNLTLDELCEQQDEAKALQCKTWIEYLTIKNIAKTPDKNFETYDFQHTPVQRKKLHGLIPLTGNSSLKVTTFTDTPPRHSKYSLNDDVDEMGAITRKKDINTIMWDTYPNLGDALPSSRQPPSDEEDPRGKVYKPSSGKNNYWESHAWPEYSGDEYDVAQYSDVEFANSGEDYSDVLDAMENNKTLNEKHDETSAATSTSTKEHVLQLADRLEEAIVAIEAIYGDTKEISREVAELTPLVTDTNEDVRTMKSEIKKLNTRLISVESTLNKLELSTTSLNNMMETIVKHLTTT